MKCNDKIKMTPEEEKSLNASILQVLTEGLDVVRKRFPNIHDVVNRPAGSIKRRKRK